MKTIKARGIVLREYEAGESDKRLTLLCKEHGRLSVYVRGARKPKSKFMAAAQIFTYGDFVLCDGRQFFSMGQAEIIEGFYRIRNDYNRLCHAHLALEICDRTVLENNPCDDLLLLLLKTLSHLNRADEARFAVSPEQAACVFLFRFFKYYGLTPETHNCCVCGDLPAENTDTGLYFCDEGVVCHRCAGQKPYRVPLSPSAFKALRYIVHAGVSEAFGFTSGAAAIAELTQAARLFWASHFQIKLHSEALIDAAVR